MGVRAKKPARSTGTRKGVGRTTAVHPSIGGHAQKAQAPDTLSGVTLVLDQLRAGDPVAFEKLVNQVQKRIRSLARTAMNSEWDHPPRLVPPTLIANDVLMKLGRQRNVPKDGKHLQMLARLMIERRIYDCWRKENRGIASILVGLQECDAPRSAGSQLVESEEAQEAAQAAFARLSRQRREVISLYLRGLTVGQIAIALSISRSTANRELKKARRLLDSATAGLRE